jgi:hypothetical protein
MAVQMSFEGNADRNRLELGFISSFAITELAGFSGDKKLAELRSQIINGELSFNEAVQLALELVNSKVQQDAE